MNETESITDSMHGLEALNRFTSGRWLWNERQQLACRHVKFDHSTLLKVAASAVGSKACTHVLKISEGQYNKLFQLTIDDRRDIIAKLPNPNAGRPHFTTASEVATMDFLRNFLNLPVPRVYAWSSRAPENPLGAEYIIMEKQSGVVLNDLVDIERRLAATKFSKFGSLYYKDDLPDNSDSTSPLYLDSTGNEVRSKTFTIGPTNHRSFFDFGRGELDIERGPWSTVIRFMMAIAQREIATAKAGLRYPLMPEGLFSGPGQYQPSLSKKLPSLQNYLKVAPYVLPENKATHASVLWHGDLHAQNIFVDPADPSRIVGIIDWQSVIVVPGLVLMDYQPLLNSLLRDVEKEWAHIIGAGRDGRSPGTPFPLQFSDEEIQQQEQGGELWAQGVELMNAFVDDTGCFKHWGGRVSDVDYEKSRRELDEGVKRFLDREARNDEERREWLKALLFVD
ncbi:hypothetical protein DTO013F2_3481 [Penicillium roqueforti]|uniref:uncharacterized protein n=1 Tax=Penicillium roqueforti TaxID=5082 RepID=UPI00190AA0F5|nr:uncharacterized protein LCP9604111_6221 [Penicillium roqueforti]KAF9247522.1 hypothetical protein LCP9604111_6221 [Penicillium roqueforti]KAI1834862.1 hypothetical protein CBS147337_4416 [Penicillium roqueforti]KAI2676705.1 hypothetical protein CBS147355_5807 [Penicillium roqueforti]KAI2683580.1 hypothetical protein LCP963914a_5981 [Penicillium roqueforti]KAI2703020.1 hypothetical protein CBS147372_3335 [Penicillium roqueforti]